MYIEAKIPTDVYEMCKQKLKEAVKRYFEVPQQYLTKVIGKFLH